MSGNRRSTDVPELTFKDILEKCRDEPFVRVQGKNREETAAKGRLVRFNRMVMIDTSSLRLGDANPVVRAYRTKRVDGDFVALTSFMHVRWADLDWVTWDQASDPNGEWLKVTRADVDDEEVTDAA